MRRVIDFQRDEAVVAADAVIDVHDEVAVGQRRRVDEEVLGGLAPAPLGPARAGAQDVLLRDHREP